MKDGSTRSSLAKRRIFFIRKLFLNSLEYNYMFLDKSLDWLSPRVCLCCSKRIRVGTLCALCSVPDHIRSVDGRCDKCFSPLLEGIPTCLKCKELPFSKMRFIWCYEKSVRDCISAIKYQPNEMLLRILLRDIPASRINLFPGRRWDIVVPIPSHFSSKIRRGFFGTKEIAQALISSFSFRYRPPLCPSALKLSKWHTPQAFIKPSLRRKNIADTLKAAPSLVSKKRVLLVDDVITTGATVEEAGNEILKQGAASVDVFALARADTWLRFHQPFDQSTHRGVSHEE